MSVARALWSRRRDHPWLVGLAILTAVVLGAWHVVDFYLRTHGWTTPMGFNDFGAYSGAVHRWTVGEPLSVPTDSGGYHGTYLYPPITVLVFYPFATLGFQPGAVVLGGLSLILLWVGLEAVATSLGAEFAVWERLALLVMLAGFQPALRDFKWAQISTLVAAGLCFACYTQELGADSSPRSAAFQYASGALTTLSSAFKLFVATAGAHLLRDRRRLLGALATAGLLGILSVAIFGLDAHRTYLDVLAWGKGWAASKPPAYWDLTAAYHPLHVAGDLALPLRAAGVLGVIALSLAARRATVAPARWATFALGVAAVPVLAPQAALNDLVVVVLPAVVLVAHELEHPRGVPWLPILSVLLVHVQPTVLHLLLREPGLGGLSGAVAWLQPAAWGTLLLLGLAARRVAEHARGPAWVPG